MKKKSPKRLSSETVITISLLVDISDVIINIVVAALSGSITLMSRALQGGVDLMSSLFLFVGAKLAKRKPDRKHPFGYGREMYFWTFLAGLAMFSVTATLSFWWGLVRLINPEPIENITLVYASLILAFVTNGYACSLSLRKLRSTASLRDLIRILRYSSLISIKTTLILDLMGTIASLLGMAAILVYAATGDYRFDGVGAMAIGLALALFAFLILRDVKDLLIGRSPPEEIQNQIIESALSYPEVEGVVDLRTTYVGSEKLFVAMEVHLTDRPTTDEIEVLTDRIESRIRQKVPQAQFIHIELEKPRLKRF